MDLSLVIYTDKRTQNKDIQNNSEFSALFYDSKNYYKFGSKGKPINNRQRTNCYLLAHGTAGI
jgi:phage regulator Rha-like protein